MDSSGTGTLYSWVLSAVLGKGSAELSQWQSSQHGIPILMTPDKPSGTSALPLKAPITQRTVMPLTSLEHMKYSREPLIVSFPLMIMMMKFIVGHV